MYDVLDVVKFVIAYSNEKDYGISNLKLQKILYMIQAYFLLQTGTACFPEKIEAWDFGPVVPSVYKKFAIYGGLDILMPKTYSDVVFLGEDKKRIMAVVDTFCYYSATDLVFITQKQAPWKNAYEPHANNEISVEEIRKYFGNC